MQDAHAPGIGYMKSKVRKGRGPAKLTEPRRVADRPMLTPTNVE